jgi:RNA polymerase sigma factor (sigma-70 family)
MEKLDDIEREALRLKFSQSCSNQEIATLMGVTPNTLGVIVFRALKKVRGRLEDQGYEWKKW